MTIERPTRPRRLLTGLALIFAVSGTAVVPPSAAEPALAAAVPAPAPAAATATAAAAAADKAAVPAAAWSGPQRAAVPAAVYPTCTISRCSAARTARTGWSTLGWPTTAGWHPWPYGQYNYTGGTFQNRERQLPSNASYNEYDVYARARGTARDAYRIVVNRATRETWFTPDHYITFYKL